VNGRPPAEPHDHDAGNYRQFVAAFQAVEGTPDRITETFVNYFGTYQSWLNFNRVKTDREGSTKPGDRRSEGNPALSQWPEGYPPADAASRSMVQVHIYAAQHFMNLCEGLKRLASDLPAVDTQEEYERLLAALGGMVRKEIPFPTYFLKPGLAALMNLTGVRLTPEGPLPDPASPGIFSVTFTASSAASAARP
jgi:hypothetical protein